MPTELEQKARAAVDAALRGRGFKRLRQGSKASIYGGLIRSGSIDVPIEVEVVDPLFTSAPTVRVTDATILQRIDAHLYPDGELCYSEQALEEYDPYDGGGAILRCLESVADTLLQVLHGSTVHDLQREFTQYWKAPTIVYRDLPADYQGEAFAYGWRQPDGIIAVLISTSDRGRGWGDLLEREDPKKVYCIQIPARLKVSSGHDPGSTLESVRSWLQLFAKPSVFERHLLRAATESAYAMVTAPNGVIAMEFAWPTQAAQAFRKAPAIRRTAWVTSNPAQVKFQRLKVESADLESIVRARLDGPSPLAGKRVAVLGCGAIGGRLAMDLAKAGCGANGGELILVDRELFVPSNMGRHVLGVSAIHHPKAEAIRRELVRWHPKVEVTALRQDLFKLLERLAAVDLVIDATGSNPTALRLNEDAVSRRRAGKRFPPIIHAAVHGNGVAVQSILVTATNHACLKCLRPAHGQYELNPLKPGYSLRSVPAACGEGAHVPYAATAPALAAAKTLQAAIEWAASPESPGPRVRTVIVDSTNGVPQKDKSVGASAACPCCNGAGGHG